MSFVDEKIARAEQLVGYHFTNKELCAQAVQMASPVAFLTFGGIGRGVENNRRLALLGETAMTQALCVRWYQCRFLLP